MNEVHIFGILFAIITAGCVYGCTQDQKAIAGYQQKCIAKGGDPMRGKGNYSYCIVNGKIEDMRGGR